MLDRGRSSTPPLIVPNPPVDEGSSANEIQAAYTLFIGDSLKLNVGAIGETTPGYGGAGSAMDEKPTAKTIASVCGAVGYDFGDNEEVCDGEMDEIEVGGGTTFGGINVEGLFHQDREKSIVGSWVCARPYNPWSMSLPSNSYSLCD